MLTYRFTMEAGSADGVCDVTRWHRVSLQRRALKTDRSHKCKELQHTASPHHHHNLGQKCFHQKKLLHNLDKNSYLLLGKEWVGI